MDPAAFVLSLVALAGLVAFVVAPLAHPRTGAQTATTNASLEILERRDRALSALRELEFDHRTGKVTDEDYAALLAPLRSAAAEALQAVTNKASSA